MNATPRADVRSWLEANIPTRANVALDAYSPYLQTQDRQISTANFILSKGDDWFQDC